MYAFHGIALLVIVFLGLAVIHSSAKPQTEDCSSPGKEHQLILEHGAFSMPLLTIQQCDLLVIQNNDNHSYLLYFGQYDNHIEYPGYQPSLLQASKSITIQANQKGSFHLHDHVLDQANLELTIR